jgi:hypothetical protein
MNRMRASLSAVLALSFVCATLGLFAGACGTTAPALRAGPMPAGGSFTGVWFSPQYGEMHLVQNGATVIGRYAKEEKVGRIQGSVEGDLLRFEWTQKRELIVGRATESKGHGYFRVAMDEGEKAWKLDGRWGNDDSEINGGPWTAIRARNRQPDIDGDGSSGRGGSSDDSEQSSDSDDETSGGSDELSDL